MSQKISMLTVAAITKMYEKMDDDVHDMVARPVKADATTSAVPPPKKSSKAAASAKPKAAGAGKRRYSAKPPVKELAVTKGATSCDDSAVGEVSEVAAEHELAYAR